MVIVTVSYCQNSIIVSTTVVNSYSIVMSKSKQFIYFDVIKFYEMKR